ncbi:MAG: hypothetical protein VX026_14100, partial [Myxococcota bacterium]|nr:hypothetical protein [Myxococcota bacterium]
HGHAVTVKGKRGRVLFSSDGEREQIVGRTVIKVRGVEKIKYITDFTEGEEPDDTPKIKVGKGVKFGSGSWMVRVKDKNAGFKQRVLVAKADEGTGVLKGKPGKKKKVVASKKWILKIQNDGGKGKWRNSQIRKKGSKGKFILHSEDWIDNDFNDLIVKVVRIQEPVIPPPDAGTDPPEQPQPLHPNIEMTGKAKLESDADFTVAQGAPNAENTSDLFHAEHKASNHNILLGIVQRIRSGDIKQTDKGIEYTSSDAEKELKPDLEKRKPKAIQEFNFSNVEFEADVKTQFKSDHVTTAQVQGEIKPPPGSNTKAL